MFWNKLIFISLKKFQVMEVLVFNSLNENGLLFYRYQ